MSVHQSGDKFYFEAPCGVREGGFDTKKEAAIAERIHKIGCKKCP